MVCGTVNSRTADNAKGTLIQRIHGLDFPHLELVRSTITPMMRSDTPSKSLDSSIIRPTVAGLLSLIHICSVLKADRFLIIAVYKFNGMAHSPGYAGGYRYFLISK